MIRQSSNGLHTPQADVRLDTEALGLVKILLLRIWSKILCIQHLVVFSSSTSPDSEMKHCLHLRVAPATSTCRMYTSKLA